MLIAIAVMFIYLRSFDLQGRRHKIIFDTPQFRHYHQAAKSLVFIYLLVNLLKHFIVNAELLLGPKEGFVVRASYDFLRRRELKLNSIGGGMGISFGVGLRISKFRLDYGRSIYHQAGANNHLSFSTNINSFTSKSKFE